MYMFCAAQRRNRDNSGIVLRKVGIPTLSASSRIVPDNSRKCKGYIMVRYGLCAK